MDLFHTHRATFPPVSQWRVRPSLSRVGVFHRLVSFTDGSISLTATNTRNSREKRGGKTTRKNPNENIRAVVHRPAQANGTRANCNNFHAYLLSLRQLQAINYSSMQRRHCFMVLSSVVWSLIASVSCFQAAVWPGLALRELWWARKIIIETE